MNETYYVMNVIFIIFLFIFACVLLVIILLCLLQLITYYYIEYFLYFERQSLHCTLYIFYIFKLIYLSQYPEKTLINLVQHQKLLCFDSKTLYKPS